jgi:hypothetical protein
MTKSDLRYDMLHHNLAHFISFFNFYKLKFYLISFIFHVLGKKVICEWMELFYIFLWLSLRFA